MSDTIESPDDNYVITVREAARIAGRYPVTIQRWVSSGFLKVAPRWGREVGTRVFLGDLLECLSKRQRTSKGRRRGTYRCNRNRLWYIRQIDRTRFRRLLETDEEREKRLKWQREYQRTYNARKQKGKLK